MIKKIIGDNVINEKVNDAALWFRCDEEMNLGGLGIYRKTREIFSRSYQHKRYWSKRGETYILEKVEKETAFPKDELIKYLRTIQFDSILEFGCGYGGITKPILDNFNVNNYTAFDLSPHQLYHAKTYCQGHDIDFQLSTIEEFESNTKFDLVIGARVLTHMPPDQIKGMIEHLLSFSRKHFIHEDKGYDPEWKFTRTSHTFRHDFARIYSEIGSLELKVTTTDYGTKIFHVQKHGS